MPPDDLSPLSLLRAAGGESFPDFVPEFTHTPGTKVIFGRGCVARAGVLARSLGGNRVLVVTDRGIADAGHLDRVLASLSAAGVEWSAFMGVVENPTTDTVEQCAAAARDMRADLLIGLGGGSSMDTAKGCNFLFTNGGEMRDYWGKDKAKKPMLPMIAIPTTSGTGSECQSYALISDAVSHAKMACGDKKAAARVAILDPDLTLSQPARVTAVTGIDAIAHAVESAVCKAGTEISRAYSHAAYALLRVAFPRVLASPGDHEARAAMQTGAALAGVAIENSMLGAAHSAANPLTAHFGIAHGEAVGMLLPHVVAMNSAEPAAFEEYSRMAALHGLGAGGLPAALTEFLTAAGLPIAAPPGVRASLIPQLANEAAVQWTAQFNPAPMNAEKFIALYEKVIL